MGETVKRLIEADMKESFLDYAMSVITARALPDVRDGLKPVHRRILYAMWELSNTHDKPFKKSARIVGEVLGKYHPHGDSAIYDSLVRMAQNFNMRYMLVEGQGNFGSIDGDSAAAMRYTEVRMERIAEDMLQDIDRETVGFTPNFDGTLKEPVLLPSAVPTLLVNGSSGIAVGMATNVPPHNLGEIIDALIAKIDGLDDVSVMKLVPGPDFPTGGIIVGSAGIYDAYTTGRGIIHLRATGEVDEKARRITFTEIPYQVTKTAIIESIVDAVRDKKIDGISNIHDRSGKEGIEIVVELKKDASGEVVLNQLYAHTPLESSFGIINIALVNGAPKTLTLNEMLAHFIEFRKEIVTRRCLFELKQAKDRAHILDGLMAALAKMDEIIPFLRASKDPKEAKAGLMGRFGMSDRQADAILDMKLQRLTGLERQKIENELGELRTRISWLESVLADIGKLMAIIKEELLALRQKYADKRRTQIVQSEDDRTIEDLIPDEETVVFMSSRGYVKRVPLSEYRTQGRGGKGVVGAETKEEDTITDVILAMTHDYLLFFTNKGRIHWLKAYAVPECGRYASGKPIVNLIGLEGDERVSACIATRGFPDTEFFTMVTRKGIVKRTGADAFANPRKGGIIAITLKEGDELIEVKKTDGQSNIFIATKEGYSIMFNEQEAREIGRSGQGVIGIRLRGADEVVGVEVSGDGTILTLTRKGYGKRTEFSEYRLQGRGGMGVININCTDKTGTVAMAKAVREGDEIIVTGSKGQTIRSPVSDIRIIGRNTQGVRIMRLDDGEEVASFAVIRESVQATLPQPPAQPEQAPQQPKPDAPKQ
jgi:DNA gyrase subunit A